MNINPKFYKEFEKKVSRCDTDCEHYYQKHIFKNDTVHFRLMCSVHGFRMHVPRELAQTHIALGAPYKKKIKRTVDPTS